MNEFYIGDRKIGGDAPCFIIAELSANHGGDINIAKETIRAAKKTGADAIKLQTFTPDTITLDSKRKEFLIDHGTIWDGQYLYDLYKETTLPWEWHAELFAVAKEEGLVCFSSPFDFTAVDLLEELGAPAYKIASPEIIDIPLIEKCARTGKPIIISTGIATLADINLATQACRKAGNNQIILLQCTTAYPARLDQANLKTIANLVETFDAIGGLSDHTLGIVAPTVAVALGAKVIEKHFILDKAIGGADASFSLDPEEFTQMVNSVRDAEQAIGTVKYKVESKISGLSQLASRSLFVVEDVKAGEIFTEKNVRSIRPGNGMHPKFYADVLGKKATGDIERGTPLTFNLVSDFDAVNSYR
ncbi:pseudaminic acid synthase [Mucilaginibacter phyllosphaerae]|uniref:Pseudaminic acid synthase n=1 Tax=Mucilaginibacter phyllosphaerae TaxID=1812349 RepID=A0A4Y8AG34_9SPHI|nr:pseudaminic acid synthase [Mucilaginibacter phyllosphaerae]MBB3968635.1 pseudaminic acid synthase [Mucilaginibacter phyllosphaerae]TEW67727.1 pseudaminic acid synthase [Mucilaginibacter phyllosphaerae]GGH14794.1 N-acetylneuraminic acid synthase [Mucilaginibacter phyllosphaerae]